MINPTSETFLHGSAGSRVVTAKALHFTPVEDTYRAYGCEVNALNVDELFRRYEEFGFLYPSKLQKLAPFLPLVRENWSKALHAGDLIHYVVSASHPNGAWASISAWRTTKNGWHTQHLIGRGPSASRAVLLASCAHRMKSSMGSFQNWFRRNNRYANKMFGSILDTLDHSVGWVGDYSYLGISLDRCPSVEDKVSVRAGTTHDQNAIRQIVNGSRSDVFLASEDLPDDLSLEGVDEIYRKIGLRRYRRILVAECKEHDGLAGLALAYRGPLGFSFSFLENRCDLILAPTLSDRDRSRVIRALLAGVASHYDDIPLKFIPLVVDVRYAPDIQALGGEHIRDYAQSIWLRDGLEPWYRHVDRLYSRAMRAESRRELGRSEP
jgi:hypothetical protein